MEDIKNNLNNINNINKKPAHPYLLKFIFITLIIVTIIIIFAGISYNYYKYYLLSQELLRTTQTTNQLIIQFNNELALLKQDVKKINTETTPPIQDKASAALYTQLSELDNELNQMPLKTLQPPTDAQSTTQAIHWVPASTTNLTWWRIKLDNIIQYLGKIVTIQRMGTNANTPTTISQDTSASIYQNLHNQMAAAMWAVLHQQKDIYQASLLRITALIHNYFINDAPATAHILQKLQELQRPPT